MEDISDLNGLFGDTIYPNRITREYINRILPNGFTLQEPTVEVAISEENELERRRGTYIGVFARVEYYSRLISTETEPVTRWRTIVRRANPVPEVGTNEYYAELLQHGYIEHDPEVRNNRIRLRDNRAPRRYAPRVNRNMIDENIMNLARITDNEMEETGDVTAGFGDRGFLELKISNYATLTDETWDRTINYTAPYDLYISVDTDTMGSRGRQLLTLLNDRMSDESIQSLCDYLLGYWGYVENLIMSGI